MDRPLIKDVRSSEETAPPVAPTAPPVAPTTPLAERIAEKLDTYRQRLDSLEEVLQACPVPVIVRDSEAEVIVYVNQAYTFWYGLNLMQIKAGAWARTWLAEDAENIVDFWRQVSEAKGRDINIRSKMLRYINHRTGKVCYSQAVGRALRSGALVAYVYPLSGPLTDPLPDP